METTDTSPERLVIELQNREPLDLIEMADCLLSAGAEYQRYLAVHESAAASEDVKLLVREVRQGSAILPLRCFKWVPREGG